MALTHPIEPITASDDEIRQALEVSDVPALLPALAHVTGDLSLLRDDLRIDPLLMGEEQGGLTPDQIAAARALALDALIRFRDGGSVAAPMPTGPDLKRILEFMAGGQTIDEYLPMMREELALTADLRAPRWHKDDVNADKPFKVVIVGAGMSGIIAAYRLSEADVPYVVLEKNDDVGGTWLENSYPGCRVDIPNHYYSYSFAQPMTGRSSTVRVPSSTSTSVNASTSSASGPTSGSAPRCRPSPSTTRRPCGPSAPSTSTASNPTSRPTL